MLTKRSAASGTRMDPLAHFKRLQMRIFGFSQKEAGAKSVANATTYDELVMCIAGAKFEEHCLNISRVILN